MDALKERFDRMLFQTRPLLGPMFIDRIPGDYYVDYSFTCDKCGYEWSQTNRIGTIGCTCPECGDVDTEFVWEKATYIARNLKCYMCGHEWRGMAIIPTEGYHCPECEYHDTTFQWGDKSDPE